MLESFGHFINHGSGNDLAAVLVKPIAEAELHEQTDSFVQERLTFYPIKKTRVITSQAFARVNEKVS